MDEDVISAAALGWAVIVAQVDMDKVRDVATAHPSELRVFVEALANHCSRILEAQ